MLVIHPKDRTTEMLSIIYEGIEADVLNQEYSNSDIRHFLNRVSRYDRIMLLGHGSDLGLFSRQNDSTEGFDRIIIGHPHAYYLRRHGGNIFGMWCNADLFARKEGLHGLFTGMIVTEMEEADLYGIHTTQEELERENIKLCSRIRILLDMDTPLEDFPKKIRETDDIFSPLTRFNYNNFFYL